MEKKRPKVDIPSNVKQTKMQRMIERAIDGDRQALKYLDLATQYVTYQKTITVSWAGLMADYKLAASTFVAAQHLQSELLVRLSKRLLHYIKFNSKGFDSEIDREATRVSIPEQLEMLRFICADLPLARMPDRSDKQEEETSSEDGR